MEWIGRKCGEDGTVADGGYVKQGIQQRDMMRRDMEVTEVVEDTMDRLSW